MACADQGSKCDISGNICYYNVNACKFDCIPCSLGTYCQMQGGLATCAGCSALQQDNSFLINGKSGSLTVTPGQLLTASVRSTTAECLGVTPEWRIVAISGSPLGFGDIRVDNGTHTFDSSGCGTTTFSLNVLGTYTLVCRWCCSWIGSEHCLASDSDLPNRIVIKVQETLPLPSGGCDPLTCAPDKNFCVIGTCVPKTYVVFGGVALLALMLLRR